MHFVMASATFIFVLIATAMFVMPHFKVHMDILLQIHILCRSLVMTTIIKTLKYCATVALLLPYYGRSLSFMLIGAPNYSITWIIISSVRCFISSAEDAAEETYVISVGVHDGQIVIDSQNGNQVAVLKTESDHVIRGDQKNGVLAVCGYGGKAALYIYYLPSLTPGETVVFHASSPRDVALTADGKKAAVSFNTGQQCE